MYLVELNYGMDDFPIQLCETLEEAIAVAKNTGPELTDEQRKAFNTDASTPICTSVITFENGKPVGGQVVRSFDRDDEGQ